MMHEKTIDQVKSDLAAVDTSAFDTREFDTMPLTVGAAGPSVGAVSPDQLAAIYPAVRAVLVALSAMWFIPAKFKVILDLLVKYLDAATGVKGPVVAANTPGA